MSGRADPSWRWLWVAVLAAVVYVLKHGYAYGVGDHDEMLPQLFRMLDPDLYPRDWFVVEQGARFTVRTPFLWLIRVVSFVLPPWAAVLALWAVGMVGVGAGVFLLGRALGASRPAAALATVGAVGVVPTWALSGSSLAVQTLTPELLGWAIAVPALVLVVRGRPAWGGVLLGLTAYVHLLVGALTTGVLGLALLLGACGGDLRQRWHDALVLGLSALAVAFPMAVLILLDRASGPPVPDDGYSSYFLIVELRLPHHYLPGLYGTGAWARFGIVTALGVAGLLWLRRRGRPVLFVERFALAVALACGIAWALTEAGRSLFVAQLQVFKVTVLLIPLFLTVASEAAFDVLSARLREAVRWPFRHPGAAWTGVGLVGAGAALLLSGPLSPRIDPVARQASDLAQVERWVRDSTRTDALFVIPPSNTSFRTGSRRSVAINYKPTSFQEGSTHVWYDRLITVAPAADPPPALGFAFADSLDAAYARNRPADWQHLADTFGADYALVDREATRTPPTARPVFAAGQWAVYRLPAPVGRTPESPF